MPRYKLTLEYDGGGFVGWQTQANGPSVQAAVEVAIQSFCGEEVRLHAAGRTDAGVHALAMAAHFDLEEAKPLERIEGALNYYLRGSGIVVLVAEDVTDEFHARFSAKARHYLYRIVNRRAPLALDNGKAWHVPVPLDGSAMHEAAQRLIGQHDFTTFRDAQCQAKSPLKTLDQLVVEEDGTEVFIHASARSFLHHQVRNMVGTLKLVGEGKWTADDVTNALNARDRAAGGPTAPPVGLYFVAVEY